MRDLSYTKPMTRKHVLVVDDSKSARVILSRMLEKYDIEVDMAESAEQAIEYLGGNRPDAIFMDHLMPGMDGLQAVKAIKGNPQTAMIPIMMYTSQEGELYVGQARALGAMGVLPKQVRPVDVSKVLYELHLLPDRRDLGESALMPVDSEGSVPVEKPREAPAAAEAVKRLESTLKEQAVEVRRFLVASLDSFASRIVGDVQASIPPPPEPLPPPPETNPALPWVWGTVGALVLAAALAAGLLYSRNQLAGMDAQLASVKASNDELQRSRQDLSSAVKDLTQALATVNNTPAFGVPAPTLATTPTQPRSELVPYGEIPFDRTRLDTLRDLLTKLETQQFHGVVHVTNLAGSFCLAGNAADGFALAPATTLISKCDAIGNPFEDSLSGQQRQSLAFANLVAGVRQRTSGAITVSVESGGATRNAMAYPTKSDSLTAGEWNKAAAANNRVEFSMESAPP